MKRTIFILGLFASVSSYSQPKVSVDTPKASSAVKMDTIVVLRVPDAANIINYIELQQSGKVDVKSEVWQEIIAIIRRGVTVVPKK